MSSPTTNPEAKKETTEEKVVRRRSEAKRRHKRYKAAQMFKKATATATAATATSMALMSMTAPSADGPFHPGKDRWSIKTSVGFDDSSAPIEIPIESFATMANLRGIEKKKFHDERIDVGFDVVTTDGATVQMHEGDFVSTTGYIRLVAHDENDSDYHVQINQHNGGPDTGLTPCLIVEVPHPMAAKEPGLAAQYAAARKFLRDNFFNGGKPTGGVARPLKVKVSGQLYFDLHHASDKPGADPGGGRGKSLKKGNPRMKATTCWEIHPVTEIEIAD